MECDRDHQGFKYIEHKPFISCQQTGKTPFAEPSREKKSPLIQSVFMLRKHMCSFYKIILVFFQLHYRNAVMICAHKNTYALVMIIECNIIEGKETSWTLREDLTKRLNKGFFMVKRLFFIYLAIQDCAQQSGLKIGNALQIDTSETHYGKITDINEIRGQHDGFFFALVTVEKADHSEMRHLLRGNVFKEIMWIHPVSFSNPHHSIHTLGFISP